MLPCSHSGQCNSCSHLVVSPYGKVCKYLVTLVAAKLIGTLFKTLPLVLPNNSFIAAYFVTLRVHCLSTLIANVPMKIMTDSKWFLACIWFVRTTCFPVFLTMVMFLGFLLDINRQRRCQYKSLLFLSPQMCHYVQDWGGFGDRLHLSGQDRGDPQAVCLLRPETPSEPWRDGGWDCVACRLTVNCGVQPGEVKLLLIYEHENVSIALFLNKDPKGLLVEWHQLTLEPPSTSIVTCVW